MNLYRNRYIKFENDLIDLFNYDERSFLFIIEFFVKTLNTDTIYIKSNFLIYLNIIFNEMMMLISINFLIFLNNNYSFFSSILNNFY